MKNLRTILLSLLCLAATFSFYGQTPDGLVYQGVLRDISHNIIPDAPIDIIFSFTAGSPAGTLVYEEEHSTVTSEIGSFSLVFGNGSKIGGYAADFGSIDWRSVEIWLKVSIYYESQWHDFPSNRIMSVPYALSARTAEDDDDRDSGNELINDVSLTGNILSIEEGGVSSDVDLSALMDSPFILDADTVSLIEGSLSIGSANPNRSKLAVVSSDNNSDDALFEVKGTDGQTIFAVYNEAVRIYLPTDPTTKAISRGGFAVGGFDRTKGEITEEYLWVTPDSIRMYIDKTPEGITTKARPRGGFAVGGFDRTTKGMELIDDYMVVSADSTRFYIDDTDTKAARGGFAVGGFDRAKGGLPRQDYMSVTTDSTRIFVSDAAAGFGIADIESGEPKSLVRMDKRNSYIGHESGISSSPEAIDNSFIGYQSGSFNKTGRRNVFIGYRSGYNNDAGHFNIFIGNESGLNNDTGVSNLFVGNNAGSGNLSGDDNVFLGISSGLENLSGNNNTFIGPRSGRDNKIGSSNVYLGYQSGGVQNGFGNVFIGPNSGLYDEIDLNYTLLIENGMKIGAPLVKGNFNNQTFHINGTLTATELAKSSDIALKENIESISGILGKVMLLNPVSFDYIQDNRNSITLSERRQFGLIAQELEEVFPELVSIDNYGYKTIDYMNFYSLLVPAIQDLKREVDFKDAAITELVKRQDEMLKMIEELQSAIEASSK